MAKYWPWGLSIFLSLIFLWVPEVPLGQDGPQHLYMGHLFSLGERGNSIYQYPQSISSYQVFARIISLFPSPIIGAKLLLTLAFLGITGVWFSFTKEKEEVSPFWVMPLFWNPLMFLGFWPYVMTLPFLLYLWLEIIQEREEGKIGWIPSVVCFLGCLIFHQLSAIIAFIFILYQRMHLKRFFLTLSPIILSIALIFIGISSRELMIFKESLIANDGLTFIESWISLKWTSPLMAINYLSHWFLGSYWHAGFVFPLLFINKKVREQWRFFVICLLILLLVPFTIRIYYKLSFFNFRILFFTFVFFALKLSTRINKNYILTGLSIFSIGLGLTHLQFSSQLMDFNQSKRFLEKGSRLGVLDFKKDQGFVSDQYHLLHFSSLLWGMGDKQVKSGQFWAGFSSHLPFPYKRPFKGLSSIPDWEPEKFNFKDAQYFDYILLRKATHRDSLILRELSKKLSKDLSRWGSVVSCYKNDCLYRKVN